MLGLGNSFAGDLSLLWGIVRTVAVWFVKPLSIDVVEQLRLRKEEPNPNGRYRYYLDFALIRSIFALSLLFLVLEETVAKGSVEDYLQQFVFLLFFAVLLFAFIVGGWLWFAIMRIKGRNMRRFIGFLIYEFATVYMMSFMVLVLFKVPYLSDGSGPWFGGCRGCTRCTCLLYTSDAADD